MKLSLHRAILGQPLSFTDYMALAAECGYQGVDVGIDEIIGLEPVTTAEAAQEIFARYGLEPACWGLPVNWRESDEDFSAGMCELASQAQLASRIGCTRCCTWIHPASASPPEELHSLYIPRFREIARTLGDFGVRLGLEWVAPRHLHQEMGKHAFIWNMHQLLDFIAEISEPNVGLLVDSFHWFNAEHTTADLEALRPEQIVYVHINDAPDRSLDDQRDSEREIPGQGIIDLAGFVRALARVGYDGCMSTEIFGDELPAMPNKDAAVKVKTALDKIVAEALGE